MRSVLRVLIIAGALALIAGNTWAESELVIAIRYLQAQGTSHAHLYLYREDGKFLRQLTNNISGQDVDPVFSPDGKTIVFTREKSHDQREIWVVDPRGAGLKKLDAPPDWYTATKSSPYFTNLEPDEKASPPATASPEESAAPSTTPESAELPQHTGGTAIDASARAEDRPPENCKAPDGSGEIFWHKGTNKEDPLDWVMWFRDLKSGKETEIGNLPGFPSFEPLHEKQNADRRFLFDGPLRLAFFESHLDSSAGDTVLAFDFSRPRLERLSTNWATPIPLPGEAGFLTLTENRYVEIPGSSKTANCSYMEHWDAQLKNLRYARPKTAAICYGASMYRPDHMPPVVTMRQGVD